MGPVLLFSNESEIAEELGSELEAMERELIPTDEEGELLELIEERELSSIILDLGYCSDAIALLESVRHRTHLPIVALIPNCGMVGASLEAGADMFFIRPFGTREIVESLPQLEGRKREMRSLLEKAERYDFLVNNISDYIWTMDLDFNYTYVSPSLYRLSGFDPEVLQSMSFQDYVLPESLPGLLDEIERLKEAIAQGDDIGMISHDVEVRNADGGTEWIELRGELVWDEDGRPEGIVGMSRVITERVELMKKLRNLNSILDSFRNLCQCIIHESDERQFLKMICEILVDVRDFHEARIVILNEGGEPWSVGTDGIDPLEVDWGGLRCVRETIETDGVMVFETQGIDCQDFSFMTSGGSLNVIAVRISHKDHPYGVLMATIPPDLTWDEEEARLMKELSAEIGFALNTRELDRQKREVEVALAIENEKFHDLFENMSIPACIYSSSDGEDFILSAINKASRRMNGLESIEVIGREINTIAPGLRDIGILDALGSVWRTGTPKMIPLQYYEGKKASGWRKYYVFRLESGEVVTTYSDLTTLKRNEKQMTLASRKLELLGKITRHDIINKLSIIKGYEQVAEDISIKHECKEMKVPLERIREATDVIVRQLDLTRDYEALGTQEAEWIDIGSIIRNAASLVELKGIDLQTDVELWEAFWDPLVIKSFENILENTLRHGGDVSMVSVSFDVKNGEGILIIEDDGVGIEDHRKESIFERGEGDHFGYGLYLVREIFRVTGSDIRECGERGVGARFEIVLPPDKYKKSTEEQT
jgi:PAS domain S-box-containing protein